MSTSGGATKASLRRHFRALRQGLVERAQPAIEAQAQRQVADLLGDGRLLGLYCPLPGEINLLSLQNLLPGRLALPAITAGPRHPSARLVYRPWRGGDPLEPDVCHIPAPLAGAGELPAEALGLLLVPALACDASGIRLGYGGGWYDRLRAAPPGPRCRHWRCCPAAAGLSSCRAIPGMCPSRAGWMRTAWPG